MDGRTGGYGLGEAERRQAGWRVSHGARSVKQQASSSFRLARRGWRGVGCSPDFMHHQPESCPAECVCECLCVSVSVCECVCVCVFSIFGAAATVFLLWTGRHLSLSLICNFHVWFNSDLIWCILIDPILIEYYISDSGCQREALSLNWSLIRFLHCMNIKD